MPTVYQNGRFRVVGWEEYDRLNTPEPSPLWANSPEDRDGWYMRRRDAPTNPAVTSPPYGLDWIGRPYFDPYYPGVREWARSDGPEIVISPESSGGRATVEGPEIRIWR